jgi:transposase-like protein
MGMLGRESRQVRAQVVPNTKRETLQNAILDQIEKGSSVYTDRGVGYDNLAAREYIHETVNHVEEYVRGGVPTRGIETFRSPLKRSLRGTDVAVRTVPPEWEVARDLSATIVVKLIEAQHPGLTAPFQQ